MPKTIMLPIDLAHIDAAPEMIANAKRMADPDSRMILLNVVQEIPSYVAAEIPGGYMKKSAERAESMLRRIAEESDIDADVLVRTGRPNTTILEVAESENVDLIVIASHEPGLEDYLLGSTAARVVRHAPCSVLVLR